MQIAPELYSLGRIVTIIGAIPLWLGVASGPSGGIKEQLMLGTNCAE